MRQPTHEERQLHDWLGSKVFGNLVREFSPIYTTGTLAEAMCAICRFGAQTLVSAVEVQQSPALVGLQDHSTVGGGP